MPQANPRSPADALITKDIAAWFNARFAPKMGAIDGHDVRFLASLLAEAAPATVVEIGCASGLSTAMIAMMLDQIGSAHIHSFDLRDNFYADPAKPVGYLLSEAPPHPKVHVHIHTGKTSLDVADTLGSTQIDFCFIDAAHVHPWPIIDTLALLPLMRPGAYIMHHDLRMYHDPNPNTYATGPKIAYDQTPRKDVVWFGQRVDTRLKTALKTRHIDGNVFAIRVPENIQPLAWSLAQGFYVGWDQRPPGWIEDDFANRYAKMLAGAYGPDVARAFEIGRQRYNSGPAPRTDLPTRALRKLRRALQR